MEGLKFISRDVNGLDSSRQNIALVTTAVLTSLATFVVLLRLCTRVFLVQNVGREDIFIVAAGACSLVYLGLVVGGEFK